MAISDGLGIQALVQSYDKKAVSQAFAEIAKDFNKSADELNNEINKIKIDKDVMNNLVNQIKALPEEVRKKTQGMSFDLFSDLINADGAEEKIDEAFKLFSNKIQSFVKLRDQIGNDKIIIETDLEDLNKLTDKMREVINLQEQIKGTRKGSKRDGLEDNLKPLQNEINTWIQARQQLEKYDVSLEEVKNTITQLANEFRDNKLGSFSFVEETNIEQIKEMVGWLERYVQLSGDTKLSGLKDFGIKGGVMDLRYLHQGNITSNDSDLRKQVESYSEVIRKYINLIQKVGFGTGSGSGNGDGFGFGASKEDADALLNTIKEIRDILNQFKDNKSLLDSEEINTLKQRISELDTQISDIQTKFKNIGVDSFDSTTNDANELLNKLGEVYDQVTSVQDKLQGLDDNVFSGMKADIDNLIKKFDAMNDQLQEFINLSSNPNVPKEEPTPSPTPEETPQQESPSADSSDVQTLEKLQEAITAVEQAIKSKTEAIQDEEVQMYASVNGEIKKLEELKVKLNEIKTEFEQGIANGLFKSKTNTDGESNGSNDGNTQSIELVPLIDDNQWMNAVDDIITKIGTKKINIEPDMTSKEWNDFKSYIEKISNLTINLNLKNVPDNNLNNDSGNKTSKPVIQNIPSAPDPSIIVPIENLSEEWENARRAAQLYDDELSDIVNVTKQIRTNEKTGERLISYRVSDDQGKQVTVGKNWNLISYTDQIADQVKAAKEQQKQQEKLLKEQKKQQEKLYKDLQKQSTEKQQQQEKTNIAEANTLLEKQYGLFKDIHTVQSEILQLQRTETSTTEDTEKLNKEINSLKEKKKLLQEEYVQNNKNLQQYDFYIDKADQLSKLQNISNTFSTNNSADAYKELDSVFKKYENIENRIAKNEIKGIDNEDIGLLDEREKILTRIDNIQNQIKTEGLTNTASDIDFSNRNKELEKNIDLMKAQADAEREIREANKSSRTGLGTSNENLKNVIDLYDRLLTNIQQIKQLQDAQSTRTLTDDEEQYLVKLQDQKIELEQRYNAELEKGYVQTSKIKEVIEETNKLLASDTNDVSLNNKTFSGRETNIDTAYDEAQKVNNALNRTSMLMDELSHKDIDNFEKPFDNASIKISVLNQRLASGSINLATYDNSVNRVVSSLSSIVEVLDETATKSDGIEAISRYLNRMSNGNTVKIIDEKTVGAVTTLTAEFEDQDKIIQRVRVSYNDLNKQVSNLGTTGKQSVTSFSKFIDELGAKFRNLITYLLSFVGFYEVWGAIQQGVTYVRELDTALTEMRKVSDETVESLREFQEESFDIADSVASTAKEIQNSTADWLRLGYAMDEASELARTTAVYKAVGDDMDIATATESMVSTLQGFQLEADQAANIVDQFNEVSNNFAIDSKGIGDALQRSAASFNAANTGMSESIALITATNAVLQDPEKVGM